VYCWGAGGYGQLGTGGTMDRSSPVEVLSPGSPPAGPQPPSGVTATAGNQEIVVSWMAPSVLGDGTLTGYTATASPGGTTCTATTATTCTITGLTNGTAYTVIVTATTTEGTSAPSGPSAPVTPTSPPVGPQPPTGVTVTPGDKAIAVSWAPVDLGADTLIKYTATASPGGKSCTVNSNGSHDTLCTIHGLTNGTPYTVTVTTTTKTGTSAASTPAGPVTPGPGPQPPTGVTAGPGDKAITVSWTPVDLGGDTLVKYTATASPGGKSCTVNSNSSHDTLCTIQGLTNGTAYTVTVTTTTKTGTSAPSAPAGPVTPDTEPPPGQQPAVITNAETSNKAITVSWQPGQQGSATLLGYTVTATATNAPCAAITTPCVTTTTAQKAVAAGLPTPATGHLAAAARSATCATTDATTCTITGLTNGTSYQVTVTTHTTAGDSTSQPATTEPAPTTPASPATPNPAPTLPTTGNRTNIIILTGWLLIITGAGAAMLGYHQRRRTEAVRQPPQ
jgi:hypothetical protein